MSEWINGVPIGIVYYQSLEKIAALEAENEMLSEGLTAAHLMGFAEGKDVGKVAGKREMAERCLEIAQNQCELPNQRNHMTDTVYRYACADVADAINEYLTKEV